MDAKALIESIRDEKRKAIAEGVLKEEKPLAEIVKKDMPRKLPDGWQWCRLGDYAMKVTDYVASGSFASLKENVLITNEENYAVMVKTADFANGFTKNLTYTDEHGYRFLENSNLFGGELILSNIGSIGKVFIVPDLQRPMTLASNTVMIRMTHNEYNKYMYYLFISPFGQKLLMSISSGTSMLKFNKTQLKSTIIPIAPLEKQKEICEVLDKLQKIISDRRSELENLDELIKARFVEMFGDLVLNPHDWESALLGTVCDVRDGTHDSPKFFNEGYPLVTSKNVTGGILDLTGCNLICEDDFNEINKRSKVDKGDILMPMIGTVGKPVIVNTTEQFAIKNVALIKFNSESKVRNTFVKALLESDYFDRVVISKVRGGTQKFIALGDIRKLAIILPPVDVQIRFEQFVNQVDKSRAVIQMALNETQLLFDSLMQKYFGG